MKAIWCGVLMAVAVAAAACGSGTTASSSAAAASGQTKPSQQPSSAAAQAGQSAPAGKPQPSTAGQQAAFFKANADQWARFKEGAKKEGKVVISGPPFPNLRQAIVQGMQKAYGITVEYIGLASGESQVRLDREAKAGKPTIDINLSGVSYNYTLADRQLIFEDVAKLVVDPDVLKPELWREGSPRLLKPMPGEAKDLHLGLQGADWVMTDLFVNRDLVQPSSIHTWKDLLKPEYKGKIASHDPRVGGSGGATLAYVWSLFGEQYVRDLYVGQGVTFTVDYRQLADWVARGNYPIGLSLVQTNVEPLRASNLPVERVFPDDGPGTTLGGFSCVFKVRGGPDPNAAAVFANWFLSKDGQEMWEKEMMETSLRTDVAHKVPDYVIPKPGIKYVDGYDPDFYFTYRFPAESKIKEIIPR